MKFAAQTLFSVVFFVFSLFIFNSPAFAQTAQPVNLHNYTQNAMIEVMSSMSCLIAGVDAINPQQKCLGVANGKIGPIDASGGALGAVTNMIAMTFYIPVNTGDYIHYLSQNFGLTKPAYAQTTGVGFDGIRPLIYIWTAFRNIAYLLFVLIFLIIGFAIMLRIHIDPRTVMTIENQIPKIVIGLILVTFSFAIAGFLIDLMYVLIYLLANVFANIDPSINKDIVAMTNPIQAANTVGGLGDISSKGAETTGAFFVPLFDNWIGRIIVGSATAFLSNLGLGSLLNASFIPTTALTVALAGKLAAGVVTAIGGVVGGVFAPQLMGFIGSIIAFIVIIVAMLVALFRLWFELLKTYVFLLLDVILAPFWIIAGLVPGSGISFTAWVRDLASNLVAFPAAIALFLLGRTVIDAFKGIPNSLPSAGTPFVPPLIGNPAGNLIGNFIGLGIILLTPQVVSMVKAAFKAPKFDMSAIAQSLGAGAAYPVNVGRRVGQTIAGGREYEITKLENQGRTIIYGPRGRVKAFFGGILGR